MLGLLAGFFPQWSQAPSTVMSPGDWQAIGHIGQVVRLPSQLLLVSEKRLIGVARYQGFPAVRWLISVGSLEAAQLHVDSERDRVSSFLLL